MPEFKAAFGCKEGDPMVRPEWGEAGRRALEAAGYTVEWHTYPMPHSVVWEEVEAIRAFLARVLA